MPAGQAQAQMYPRIAHFQTFFAAARMRLDVANLVRMRASLHGSSPPAHLRTVRGPALADLHTPQKNARAPSARKESREEWVAPSGRLTNALALAWLYRTTAERLRTTWS